MRSVTPLRSFLLLLLSGLGIAFSFLQTGCSPQQSRVESGNAAGILHVGNGAEPEDLDPQTTTGLSELNLHLALFEGLLAPGPENLQPVPGVAERWEASEEGRRWTFHLREEARWSNGDPVTARDFLFAWERILTPALGAPNAGLLYVVRGAEALHRGETTDFSTVGFSAPDANTLVIELTNAIPWFESLLMHPAWYPVHPPTVRAAGGEAQRGSGWTRPGSHVGNGPFQLESWQPRQVITVSRNPYYWDAEAVALAGIHFYPVDQKATEERLFQSGQLHLTYSLPAQSIGPLTARNAPELRLDPALGTEYYLFNTQVPPFDQADVRRALALALDRASLTRQVLRGGQNLATSFTPPGTGGYDPPPDARHDPAAAREALAQAGYPMGEGFPSVTLLFSSSENNRLVAEAAQAMWQEVLSIRVTLANMEAKSFLAARRAGDFMLARSSWLGDYPDAHTFLGLWTTNSPYNYGSWSDPAYDAAMARALAASDLTARHAAYREAEAILLQEAAITPLFHYVNAYLIAPSVQGYQPTLLHWHPWKYVSLD